MAITNGYTTLDEFKAYAKITATDASDDAVIENIIEGISRQIDRWCKREFFTTSATARYFASYDGITLYVDDISSAVGLIVASDDQDDLTYSAVWAATDYNLLPYNPRNQMPYTRIEIATNGNYSFNRQRRGNKITAAWGFAAIPEDVRQACLIISEAEYHSRFGENMSGTATITGAGVVITPKGFPSAAVQKLEPFRRLV